MFWLCSVSLSLLDYRLIAINALIYDLIATEIVNANTRIVVAATVMTEFDKSATRAITGTTTTTETETIATTNTKRQRLAHEMSTTSEATTMKTAITMKTTANTIRSNATADEAFFAQKLSDDSDDDEISTNNNNNSNNQFTKTTNGTSNNTAQLTVQPASANVTFVSIAAAARPLAMWAHNFWRYNNDMTVMPTINGRVDNFRNGKKQTNERTTTTKMATAAKVERNVAASTVAVVAPKRTTTAAVTTGIAATLAISKSPTIKPTVITAIESTAMHLTTSALTTPTVMTAGTTEATATTTTAGAQVAESAVDNTATAEAFKASSKWATALATTTAATAVRHATPSWPTLRSHDLLSSTNGLPNCRNATSVSVPTEKSHAETNINTAATATTTTTLNRTTLAATTTTMDSATAALLSTSSAVRNTTLNHTKVTATMSRAATTTTTNTTATSVAYVTDSVDTATSRVASTPMRSLTPCPTYSSPATTTIEATKKTSITENAATNSTAAALQTQWQRILSRRKRYLAFPEGTSFTVSICITVGIIGNPNNSLMSYGLNWGVAYDLPNASWVLNQLHGLSQRPRPMSVNHRRSKRTIYERIAETVDNMGYSGRNCVLRALCESRQYFARTKMGMIGEILRVIFSLPKQRIFSRELRENSDIIAYDHAYRKARSLDCVAQYDCPFSLLELAFGKYSIPTADYYGNSGM